jgi:hypothetical protein
VKARILGKKSATNGSDQTQPSGSSYWQTALPPCVADS